MAEYDKLSSMADEAESTLRSLLFGNHYALKVLLKSKYGISGGSREDDIRSARRLCEEFITAYNAE